MVRKMGNAVDIQSDSKLTENETNTLSVFVGREAILRMSLHTKRFQDAR